MSGTDAGEYGRATALVLQGLLSSADLVRSDRHAEAVEVVRGMRAAVAGLHGAAATARQGAASEATVSQEQLESLELRIGQIYAQEQAVQAQIGEVEAQLAAQKTRAAHTRGSIEALRQAVAGLEEEVRAPPQPGAAAMVLGAGVRGLPGHPHHGRQRCRPAALAP